MSRDVEGFFAIKARVRTPRPHCAVRRSSYVFDRRPSPHELANLWRTPGAPKGSELATPDVRFGARTLPQNPGFTIVAVTTLALGIGVNTAIFTLAHAVLLRSLPVAKPEHLYNFGDNDNCCVERSMQDNFTLFSTPLYEHLRDQSPEFEDVALFPARLSRSEYRLYPRRGLCNSVGNDSTRRHRVWRDPHLMPDRGAAQRTVAIGR